MTRTHQAALESLLEHSRWTRELARHLVRDPHDADDLVQRAWLAALQDPPPESTPPRRWLAAVLRNLAREGRRNDGRRTAREAAAARPERVEARDTSGEIELQRRLLDAVRDLPEPYRAAIWARYFDGLAPREIAARDATPLKTVKTRLARGLELLRARFDHEHGGDRRAWSASFLPWIDRPALPAAWIGVAVVNVKLKVAGALALVVGALWIAYEVVSPDPLEPRMSSTAVLAPSRLDAPPVEELDETNDALARASAIDSTSSSVATPAASAIELVRGRAIDLEARPVADLAVSLIHVRPIDADHPRGVDRSRAPDLGDLRTSRDGRFEFALPKGSWSVVAEDATHVTVFAPRTRATDEVVVHVAPRRALAGSIVDARGTAIVGARVELRLDDALRRREGLRLDDVLEVPNEVSSDAHGRFELLDAPLCRSQIVASALGRATKLVPAPDAATYDLVIALDELDQRPAIVRGRVVDAERSPVAGAWVAFGIQTQRTGADGRFEIDLTAARAATPMQPPGGGRSETYPADVITAIRAGSLPARVAVPSLDELAARTEPFEVELVLPGPPLAIEGIVVDAEGNPVAGASIHSPDDVPLGEVMERVGATGGFARKYWIEEIAREGDTTQVRWTREDGRFRITGLQARDYTLAVQESKTLRRTVSAPIRAGTLDARIDLPVARDLVRVAGRVVSRTGKPVGGVLVKAGVVPEPGGSASFPVQARTNDDGRFDLGRLASVELRFQVLSPHIFVELEWMPPRGAALDALEIEVARLEWMQVDLGDDVERANAFTLLDANGATLRILHHQGSLLITADRHDLVQGKSVVVGVEETARTLVLWKYANEVARAPIAFGDEEVTLVRP